MPLKSSHIRLGIFIVIASLKSATATELAKPSPKQLEFADWEVGAFFHNNLNPFTGQEHGDGQEPPSKFNPTRLDIEQWILTAKSMGARYAVLTARHKGGPIDLGGKTYQHGILLCPTIPTQTGIAEFDLKPFPQATGIKANIGIEEMVDTRGSVTFAVEVYLNGQWSSLYQSPLITGGQPPLELKLNFPQEAERLRLKTTNGGDNSNSDHAVWADLQFTE